MDDRSVLVRTQAEMAEMAEGQGFEPWMPLDMPVFKTGAFNHSATPPSTSQGRGAQYT